MSNSDLLDFFTQTIEQAGALPIQTIELDEGQGLLLLSTESSRAEKLHLLRQAQQLVLQENTEPDLRIPQESATDSTLNCQVTVEERAQLFAFLNK